MCNIFGPTAALGLCDVLLFMYDNYLRDVLTSVYGHGQFCDAQAAVYGHGRSDLQKWKYWHNYLSGLVLTSI